MLDGQQLTSITVKPRVDTHVRLSRFAQGSLPCLLLDVAALLAAAWFVSAPPSFALVLAAVAVAALSCTGAYRRHLTERVSRDGTSVALALGLVLALSEAAYDRRPTYLARLALVCVLLLIAARILGYVVRRLARAGWPVPTLIVGSSRTADAIADSLDRHRGLGLRVARTVYTAPPPVGSHLPLLLQPAQDLPEIVSRYGIRALIFAVGTESDAALGEILRRCDQPGLDVYVVPRPLGLCTGGSYLSSDELWGFPVVRASRWTCRHGIPWEKRLLDVVASSGALIVFAPIIACGAVAAKLASPGPVFFKQDRVGQHGRIVKVLKLRTMPVSPDCDTRWTVSESDLGRIGRLMRKTSIDELPQLWNVLRGDMSLVGPRPERVQFARKFSEDIEGYADRHRVPVGLTGWAQIHGLRGDTSIDERARFDNYYIEHWSIWLDLTILARTFLHICKTAFGWTKPQPVVADLRQPRALHPVETDGSATRAELQT